MSDFATTLDALESRIQAACDAAQRSRDDVTLVAASKTVPPEWVCEAFNAGIRDFGENKVQEAAAKIPLAPSAINWHFIGHLQSNKARHAIQLFSMLHAVDSVSLIETLAKLSDDSGLRPAMMLHVNLAAEASKSGLSPDALFPAVEAALASPLPLVGLMTMPPFDPNVENTRRYFSRLRELRDDAEREFGISLPNLSMGMSHDFEAAILEGATHVRIGSLIFGNRPKPKLQRELSSDDF
jgi:pyridoxal phosphate enzyme (YggS family)